MAMSYKRCVETGKIAKFNVEQDMVKKEVFIAREDLNSAQISFASKNYK